MMHTCSIQLASIKQKNLLSTSLLKIDGGKVYKTNYKYLFYRLQIDKSPTRKLPPPPVSPKPKLPNGRSTLTHRIDIETTVPPDNSDSGVDMGINSPPLRFQNSGPSADTDLLDDIMHHMTNNS